MTFDHITDPLVAERAAIKWEEAAERSLKEWLALGDEAWGKLEAVAAWENATELRALAARLRGE